MAHKISTYPFCYYSSTNNKIKTYKLPGALDENCVIDRVLFRNPATIVFWNDGTKTVTKCSKDDTYSKEAGLAICCLKKAFGKRANECLKAFIDLDKLDVNMNDIRKLLKNK